MARLMNWEPLEGQRAFVQLVRNEAAVSVRASSGDRMVGNVVSLNKPFPATFLYADRVGLWLHPDAKEGQDFGLTFVPFSAIASVSFLPQEAQADG